MNHNFQITLNIGENHQMNPVCYDF